MNQTQRKCHEIPKCPNLYIDAFRTHKQQFLSPKKAAVFILTHYHADHYTGLPRDYNPPSSLSKSESSKIHCTPITAALLKHVHGVHEDIVIEHEYGVTWDFIVEEEEDRKKTTTRAEITFYDANHCPGAAIVFIRLVHTTTTTTTATTNSTTITTTTTTQHLHTGDFRYHSKMNDYPLLQQASLNGSSSLLDVLYLDTTYSHPKYDFVDQNVAVDLVVSQVMHHLLLSSSDDDDESTNCNNDNNNQKDEKEVIGKDNAFSCTTTTTTTTNNNTNNCTKRNNNNNNQENDNNSSDDDGKTLILLSCYSIGKKKYYGKYQIKRIN